MAEKVYHSVLERVIDDLRMRPSSKVQDPYYLSPVDWAIALDELRLMSKNAGEVFIPSATPDCLDQHYLVMGAPIIPRARA